MTRMEADVNIGKQTFAKPKIQIRSHTLMCIHIKINMEVICDLLLLLDINDLLFGS